MDFLLVALTCGRFSLEFYRFYGFLVGVYEADWVFGSVLGKEKGSRATGRTQRRQNDTLFCISREICYIRGLNSPEALHLRNSLKNLIFVIKFFTYLEIYSRNFRQYPWIWPVVHVRGLPSFSPLIDSQFPPHEHCISHLWKYTIKQMLFLIRMYFFMSSFVSFSFFRMNYAINQFSSNKLHGRIEEKDLKNKKRKFMKIFIV